ncbi:hypothetical protein DIPPA_09236 [Diplonema papillatum]|nr:hypothetical protein DIPPA_09236 [Diplonema papillatum]
MQPAREVTDAVIALQSHFSIIEQEIAEIDKDTTHIEECICKYGDVFSPALGHLVRLRESKKQELRNIIMRLDHSYASLSEGKHPPRD